MNSARAGRPDRAGGKGASPRGVAFLSRGFVAGALYDVAASVLILASPGAALRLAGIPVPPDPMHFRFAGLLLLVLPLFYLLPAREPLRYSGVASAAIGARLAGAVFLGLHVAAGAPTVYAAFAAMDLLFAALHAAGLLSCGLDLLGRVRSGA